MDNVGVYIGTSPGTVEAAHKSILEILTSPHTDERTKRVALKALSAIAGPPVGATVTNSNFTIKYLEPEPEDDQEYEGDQEPED